MKRNEAGFTLIELVVVVCLMALLTTTASSVTIYILQNHRRNADHMAALFYTQTAGYWLMRDTLMAGSVTTDGLSSPDLLVLSWTDWDIEGNPTYHGVTYSFEDVSGGIGKLKRTHQDSNGSNEESIVTNCFYYDDADPESSQMSYADSVLTFRIVTRYGNSDAVREYQVRPRPNLN